ncbi:hypothetical protein BDA99DRAFT_507214 [Phascolomyces articulosus]|uniref:RFX-type winged-helix domain-containing protein n=1 Tax=Phascolomyces articulosus TaxID=60185 RepID=A0AAD5PEK6_9FUNG|nr:hypothetical protein BDA99DRAFT_507214 [Phascolomyces articulosus]
MARNRSRQATVGATSETEQQQPSQQHQQGSSGEMSGSETVATASDQETLRSLRSRTLHSSSSSMSNVNVTMTMGNDGHDNNDNLPRRSARIRQNNDNTNNGQEEVDQLQQEQSGDTAMDVESVTTHTTATPGAETSEGTTATRRGGTRHGVQTENEDSRFVLQWVRENYQYEQDHNVPRSGMYEHYRSTCGRNNPNPVNSATFGKLIRHVFPDITTRRLGTRGQSRYHYCGIRRRMGPPSTDINTSPQQHPPSSSSPHGEQQNYPTASSASLAHMSAASSSGAATGILPTPQSSQQYYRHQQRSGGGGPASSFYQVPTARRMRGMHRSTYSQQSRNRRGASRTSPEGYSSVGNVISRSTSSSSGAGGQGTSRHPTMSVSAFRGANSPASAPAFTGGDNGSTSASAFVSSRMSSSLMVSESGSVGGSGTMTSSAAPPSKRLRSNDLINQGISRQHDVQLPSFTVSSFASQNKVMMEFAHLYEQHCVDVLSMIQTGRFHSVYGCLIGFYQMLPDRFRVLIDEQPEATEAIWRWDCALYDSIFVSMLPTVQSPLSHQMNKDLREYTRELDNYLDESLNGYPEILRERKIEAARIFVSQFRRHLKLNQMAQAAAGLLRRPTTLEPMLSDWKKVDIPSILDQTHWSCDCDGHEIQRMLSFDICNLLETESNLEQWITWMQGVIERYMSTHQQQAGRDAGYFIFYAKQFVLKWSIYTSLILKDMTLSGAKSIDQFRILALFFDDMMQFLVESRIAKAMAPQFQQTSLSAQQHRHSTHPSSSPSISATPTSAHCTFAVQTSSSTNTPAPAMLETPPPSTSGSSRRDINNNNRQQTYQTSVESSATPSAAQ